VVENRQVVGILSMRDLFFAADEDAAPRGV
jgi:hypothetical protein